MVLQVPNGFGCGLGVVQLILYFIFRGNKGESETKKPTDVESVEMGLPKPNQDKQSNNPNGSQVAHA